MTASDPKRSFNQVELQQAFQILDEVASSRHIGQTTAVGQRDSLKIYSMKADQYSCAVLGSVVVNLLLRPKQKHRESSKIHIISIQ